jgi:hypothetical protein
MSESTSGSGAVKVVLAVGFVVAVLMVIGFAGVFFLVKYQHEQEQQAAEEERIRQEQEENSETLGAIGGALGESVGEKIAEKLGDRGDAETLKKAAGALGESIGREVGRSDRSKEFIDSLEAAGETIKAELQKKGDTSDTPADDSTDSAASEPDA